MLSSHNTDLSLFSHQISHLSKTVESMSGYGPRVGQASVIESMAKDLEHLKLESESADTAKTQPIFSLDQVQLFVDLLSNLARAEESLQAEAVIASLNYDCRPVRHGAIPRAHKDTLHWAFNSQLSDWLQSGSGIFWVSGKAGSGKSTFMKFLADHPQTRKLLARWTDPKEPAIAAHYFWSAGTAMQRSQQGLLQSLLFDIFRSYPTSIPVVCPDRWAKAKYGSSVSSSAPWTINELSDTLRAVGATEDMSLKFCFFIDGLDEYKDDAIELCSVLRDMSRSSSIKICLSSRPWVVFEDSFGADPLRKLYMHDLTQDDIERFARDQLQTHPRWAVGSIEIGEDEKRDLIQQVAERAEGVFLWAFLVTRSLREGLSNDDTIADMWRRLQSLPTDLEHLFKHMLDSVDAIYHSKMAGALQVAIHAFEPLSADIYWHLEKGFEEQDYAILCPIGVTSTAQRSRQREQARRRINARTKGLLETRNDRVEFLHRTVRDFLLTGEMSDYLTRKLSTSFNAFNSIAKSYLSLLKTTSYEHPHIPSIARQGPGHNGGLFVACLNQALLYAAEALKTSAPNSSDVIELLDEYERSVVKMVEISHVTIRSTLPSCDPRLVFREEVIRHELAPYVQRKLQKEPGYFSMFEHSPLFAALTPMTLASGVSPCPAPEMLEILLKREYDLNAISTKANNLDAYSPWVFFMRTCTNYPLSGGNWRFCEALEKGIFNLLLSHGANPDALVHDSLGWRTSFCNFLITLLTSKEEYFETSLGALDAFLLACPSLSIIHWERNDPDMRGPVGDGVIQLSRNEKAIESLLATISRLVVREKKYWPTDLKGLKFFCTVLERLIRYGLNKDEDLAPLASALREGCVWRHRHHAAQLLDLIEGDGHDPVSLKRRRDSSGGGIDGGGTAQCQSKNRGRASRGPKRRKAVPCAR